MSRYAAIAILAAVALPALAQDTQPTSQPTTPYIDLFNGFSIELPRGLERTNIRSAAQLVTWSSRSPKSHAILWTLAVNRVKLDKSVALKDQMDNVSTTLKEKEQFEVESADVIKVAGAEAFDIKGKETVKKIKWWQRQVWIAAGDHYLIWRITGPADGDEEMDKALSTVLDSIKLIDPKEAIAQREKNLQAGAAWLKGLTKEHIEKRLKPVLQQYYQVVDGGKTVGSAVITSEVAKDTFTFSSLVQMQSPQRVQVSVVSRALFERTSEITTVRMKVDKEWETVQEDTLLNGTLSCRTPMPKGVRTITTNKEVPAGTYLPMAFQLAMPYLVDWSKPATMSFAISVPRSPSFDVFTVKVEEPQEIAVGDKKVKAVRVDIQRAEDQGADAFWVDAATGLVVMTQPCDGASLVQSTKEEVEKIDHE